MFTIRRKKICKQVDIFQVPVDVGAARLISSAFPRQSDNIEGTESLWPKPGWFPTLGALFIYWLQIPPRFNIAESMEKHAIKNHCIWVSFLVKIN